jgi:replicative DNA helicase
MNARAFPDASSIQPPHSVEAEHAVLGGLLLDNGAWNRIADVLSENDFYRQDHRQILRAIVRQIAENRPADAVTVAESLQSMGALENVGGLAYIVALASNTPSAANIRRYAEIVRERAQRRALIEAAHRIADSAYDAGVTAEQRIERATAEMLRLADGNKAGREAVSLKDALREAMEALDHRVHNPGVSGLSTGFADLDAITCGLQAGDLIIVAGRPSMGKTTWATNIAENVALAGQPVFFASLEMSAAQLAERGMARFGHVSTTAMRSGKLNQRDYDGLTASLGRLHDAPLLIADDPASVSTAGRIRLGAIKARQRFGGLALIVIDYLQLMRADGNTRNEELGAITRALKLTAKELNVPIVLLSQLSRKVEERADKRPLLSDLRESGAIEQDADVALMCFRDEYYNPDSPYQGLAEIIVRKQRMGPLGTLMLRFEGEFSRFSDADQNEVHAANAKAHAPQTARQPRRGGFND